MKSIFIIFLFLSICFYSSSAQDFPTKSTVLKIIGDVSRKLVTAGENELGVDSKIPFRYIDAKFTSLPTLECIVIAPVLFGGNTRDLVIHFSKTNSSAQWTKDYLHLSENAWYSYESADTIDLNPTDGLKELTYSFGSMLRGYEKNRFSVISLRNGKEKVIYSSNSFLLPGEDEYAAGLTVGDTVYVLDSVAIKDLDNDGIKEISETKSIGLLMNKELPLGETYWDMDIEDETYLTVLSYKNGVFIRSKPKLIPSKPNYEN